MKLKSFRYPYKNVGNFERVREEFVCRCDLVFGFYKGEVYAINDGGQARMREKAKKAQLTMKTVKKQSRQGGGCDGESVVECWNQPVW